MNQFLNHLVATMTPGFTNNGVIMTWFNARKAKIKGSKAATALGWYGRKAMLDYCNQLSSDMHSLQTESNE